MATPDPLKAYKSKRDFAITCEPAEGGVENLEARSFVIQKHWATRLHYDFRLELDGTMKSWAIPKGPSFDTKDKRMAVHVEDHPISYSRFEGQIPAKQYGAGKVIIWDKGSWLPIGDPQKGYRDGNLKFELHGHKLHGKWALIRLKGNSEKKEPWLLIKERDDYVRAAAEFSVVDEMPDSVAHLKDYASKPKASGKKTSSPTAKRTTKTKASTTRAAATSKSKAVLKQDLIPSGAKKSPLPAKLSPQLASLAESPPKEKDWLYEIKFDGYRIVTKIEGDKIQLFTRNGNDWTAKLPKLAQAIADLKLESAWLDGEIVVADENGIPNFQALQNAFDAKQTTQIIYYIFDLPHFDGYDLREAKLIERRALLQAILHKNSSPFIHFSETFDAPAADVVTSACRLGLEGVIGKRKDSLYSSRRSRDWIKLKCTKRQEFVIGGFTEPKGARQGLGALLLGVHDAEGNLLYAGSVGTGFSEKILTDLRKKLDAIVSKKNPFSSETDSTKKALWVKPTLLAEISFAEWTNTGHIRHAVFLGLRADKAAKGIVREQDAASHRTSKTQSKSGSATQSGFPSNLPNNFTVSHADRVVDTSIGVTKIDLIRYYASVGQLMMPHLKGRPVSLVRAPDGIDHQLFFQKHMETPLAGIALLDPALDPEHEPLMEIAKPLGLMSAAQMNVVEFHTWNAVKSAIDKPDRMTFDLDPGEDVSWALMQEATILMGSFLQQLGLQSFVKTSGGKGMHVVVPLKRRYDWDTVKAFSQAIVKHMAATLPMRFVAKSGPKNRKGKIFIDYLRNGFGATAVAAWSVRSRPGMGVSVPVAWEEVEKLHSSAQWTVENIHTRLDQGNTPWSGYDQAAQNITVAMKMIDFTPERGE